MGWPGAEELLRACRIAGVRDPRVLEALGAVRRAAFLPEAEREQAHRDGPLPIARGQVTTQPSLVAMMVEALRLTGEERVLEIGTGLGYQAAILSHLAREVWSIERFAELAQAARQYLAAEQIANVQVRVGDGTLGLPGAAPFDAIVIAAAAPRVPAPLIAQLVEGGRLVQPIGPGGDERVEAFVRRGGVLVRERLVTGASFVPLVGAHGLPR